MRGILPGDACVHIVADVARKRMSKWMHVKSEGAIELARQGLLLRLSSTPYAVHV